ncbi:MAG: NfeD family protein [Janibacter sp.]
MATTQPADLDPPSVPPDGELGDVLSWLVDQLGIGWGLLVGLVLPTLVVAAVGVALTVWLWRRTRESPSHTTGSDLFTGHVVTIRTAEGTHGQTFVEGSWWSVRSTGVPLAAGEDVRVREVDGLVLLVEPLEADPPTQEER